MRKPLLIFESGAPGSGKSRFRICAGREREGWTNEWFQDYLAHLDKIYDKTVEPLDLGVPIIEVDATDEYIIHL